MFEFQKNAADKRSIGFFIQILALNTALLSLLFFIIYWFPIIDPGIWGDSIHGGRSGLFFMLLTGTKIGFGILMGMMFWVLVFFSIPLVHILGYLTQKYLLS